MKNPHGMEFTSIFNKAITVTAFVAFLVFPKTETSIYSNVALHKPSEQSSDLHPRAESHLANDGNLNQDFSAGFCTHTRSIINTWWLVDLLIDHDVHAIGLLNRNRDTTRLTDFYIYVSRTNPIPIPGTNNTFKGQLCLHHPGTVSPNGVQVVSCSQSVKGRFVYLWKPANSVLTLCEFQVLVPDTKRESTCINYDGQRSALPAVYFEYVQPASIFRCYVICMSKPERMATHVQLNKRTGKCECMQYSPLIGVYPGTSTDPDFALCQTTEWFSYT